MWAVTLILSPCTSSHSPTHYGCIHVTNTHHRFRTIILCRNTLGHKVCSRIGIPKSLTLLSRKHLLSCLYHHWCCDMWKEDFCIIIRKASQDWKLFLIYLILKNIYIFTVIWHQIWYLILCFIICTILFCLIWWSMTTWSPLWQVW